eukprot:jgi/Bigna1/87753/estExt_fgenesh1_pg.C_230201
MGINGLLPLLKPVSERIHIKRFKGETVAVDASCWLHRGAYVCATELCLGIPTAKYAEWCMKRINVLRGNGIEPHLVFDGAQMPLKRDTESKRKKNRTDSLQKGLAFYKAGNRTVAAKHFQRAIRVDSKMVCTFMQMLREENVKFTVAPYEADAQLAYLARKGDVAAVISEDSDLLAFGCPKVIFKMDDHGSGILICLKRVVGPSGLLRPFGLDQFRDMCILSGCDYLPSIPGIGLKKAQRLVRVNKNISRIVKKVKWDVKFSVPKNYEENFEKAVLGFCHQRVFDRETQSLVHLTPLSDTFCESHEDDSFLGALVPGDLAVKIAQGFANPRTKEEYSTEYTKRISKIRKNDTFHAKWQLQPPSRQPSIEAFVKRKQNSTKPPAPKSGQIGRKLAKRHKSMPIYGGCSYLKLQTSAKVSQPFRAPRLSNLESQRSDVSTTQSKFFGQQNSAALNSEADMQKKLRGLCSTERTVSCAVSLQQNSNFNAEAALRDIKSSAELHYKRESQRKNSPVKASEIDKMEYKLKSKYEGLNISQKENIPSFHNKTDASSNVGKLIGIRSSPEDIKPNISKGCLRSPLITQRNSLILPNRRRNIEECLNRIEAYKHKAFTDTLANTTCKEQINMAPASSETALHLLDGFAASNSISKRDSFTFMEKRKRKERERSMLKTASSPANLLEFIYRPSVQKSSSDNMYRKLDSKLEQFK